MAFRRFRLTSTSERTAEINVLADIISELRDTFNVEVTVISPSQPQEADLGFDELLHGLPRGIIKVIQFKKPHPYSAHHLSNFARFYIDTMQLQILLGNFRPTQAYYAFLPLPTTIEIITNRVHLLDIGTMLDIYDVPRRTKTSQITRTVRVSKIPFDDHVEVADPRKFEKAKHATTIKNWCKNLLRKDSNDDHFPFSEKRKKLKFVKGLHYLHIRHI